MALFLTLTVAAFAVTPVLRLISEERSGHTEGALATAVSRRRWIALWLGFAALASTVLLLITGLLDPPGLFANLSPFGNITAMPLSSTEALPLVVLTAIGAVLSLAATLRFARRDLDRS